MKFYNEPPSLSEVTMCTVIECNPSIGFNIHLDEYNKDGILMLRELSNRKIKTSIGSFLKVGTTLPLQIIDIDQDQILLSKKDVKPKEKKHSTTIFGLNKKMFSLAKRLSITTSVDISIWESKFREMLSHTINPEDHPFTIIQSREISKLTELDESLIIILNDKHAKMFGITPMCDNSTMTMHSFGINGMEFIKNILIKIRDRYLDPEGKEWSKEKLYDNQELANVRIIPSAIPTFQLQITSYQKNQCEKVKKDIINEIKQEELDYFSSE